MHYVAVCPQNGDLYRDHRLCDVIKPYVLAEVSHDLPLIKRRH